jgi:site-specific recombinase
MFMTTGLALIFITAKLFIGCVIGLAAAALTQRSRWVVGLAIRAALFGGVAFLIASGIAGWAGSHVAFQNGHRLDIAPWGEDPRLRNYIAEHELALCVASSSIAAILAGVRIQRSR